MTKTAIEMRKLATQKEMQDKELKWKSSENKKDRRKDYILKGAATGASILGNTILKRNDPAWYKKYIKDLDKFTNIPTYHRLGVPLAKASYITTGMNGTFASAIPGIMTFTYEDMVGPQINAKANMSQNPVNQILMRSKEQVLKSNSRSSVNWEAADLGLNLFATASILTMLGEYKRLILCAQTYSATNAYLGLGLLRAWGLDESAASKFVTELALHRKNYVILAHRFNNAIVAPAGLSLFHRKWYLATNVFADNADPARPQLYWFRDAHSYKLNADGSALNPDSGLFSISQGGSVADAWFNLISGQITAIVDNPDFQEMYADLRSAFGDNLLKLEETLDENETLAINIEELNREQIRNLKTLPVIMDGPRDQFLTMAYAPNALKIVSDTSGYLYQGEIDGTVIKREANVAASASYAQGVASGIDYEYSIDSVRRDLYNVQSLDKVNGDAILDITRFRFSAEAISKASDTALRINITDCGTEVVSYATIGYYTADPAIPFRIEKLGTCILVQPSQNADLSQFLTIKALSYYSAFDWSPNIRIYFVDETDQIDTINPTACTIGDMANTFVINKHDLAAINQACVLSELYLESTTFKR